MGINKIVYGGVTKLDISNDTVTPSSLLEGYTAHDNTGTLITGTASGGSEHGNVWQDSEGYVVLDDESGISLQTKSATPSESAQTVKPDSGYYALDKVNIGAISSTYVGSGITQRSSSDLTVSGATVTTPSGYYSASASKSVASGTAGTPTATKGSVSNHSISVTPSVTNTTGYISGGTKNGTAVTVSASELVSGTLDVNSSGTKDVTNYASASIPKGTQGTPSFNRNNGTNSVTLTPVVVNSAGYINGGTKTGTAVTISASELVSGTKTITENGTTDVTNYASASVPSGTTGTPTATKGSVSNHSVTVTPSVTNTTGFIAGSTKTGTAVSVSASELVSGTKSITENGTGIDVTNYANVDVNVPSVPLPFFTATFNAGVYAVTCDMTYAQCASLLNVGDNPGANLLMIEGEYQSYWGGNSQIWDGGTNPIVYTFNTFAGTPSFDIVYYANGTLEWVSTSSTLITLTATQNGTYTPPYGKVYNEVNVNVSTQKKYYATITSTGNATGAYVRHPSSSGTKYYTVGDSFEIQENDEIYMYGTSTRAGTNIYVNEELVRSSVSSSASYTYAVPSATNVEISLTYGNPSEIYLTEIPDPEIKYVSVTVTTSLTGTIFGPTFDAPNHLMGYKLDTGSWSASGYTFSMAFAEGFDNMLIFASTSSNLTISATQNAVASTISTLGNVTFYTIKITGDNAAFSIA